MTITTTIQTDTPLRDVLGSFAADLLERLAADVDAIERPPTASVNPSGYAAGYTSGKAEILDRVARGLVEVACELRMDPSRALDPPMLRLA